MNPPAGLPCPGRCGEMHPNGGRGHVPRIAIDGIGLAYELHGPENGRPVALTPGGRFHMDTPGVRDFALALAEGGRRVLIYDRPNCGRSDACLSGESESAMQAEALLGLIRALDLGPTAIIGGSGGARVSLLAAARDPDLCSHLAVWWISGGPIGLMQLATYYCGEAAAMASIGGMDAVMAATSWAENFALNPAARAFVHGQDPQRFIATMQAWAAAYAPSDISPVPGMKPVDFARLTMPALVYRSHASDLSHTRATSEWVHRLIPQSRLADPPWRDDEWNHQLARMQSGQGNGLFTSWPALAPAILDLTA
jgi:pimeloyl-ACP methyl ester carboxylesterase